ncbi:MAG: MFS transporter, partial [Pseudomonas sp.]|nr:MFS transporter [Pseudomonas sp.]
MKAHSCGSGHAAILTVASAFFLEVLDATIMLMAIIPMANDLGASISGVTLSLATYLLALVLFLPLSGHLFNRFALAQQFLCGLAIFCLASLACAISQNIYLLCIARLVQGFGSALVVPAGRALILANTPKIAIPKTMAWLIAPALVAPMVAPYMANLLLNIGNWRLI